MIGFTVAARRAGTNAASSVTRKSAGTRAASAHVSYAWLKGATAGSSLAVAMLSTAPRLP